MKEIIEVLQRMQECINELKNDVDRLDEDQGIQIGNSSFDYMDQAMDNLKNKLKGEM
jgi:hypothetical protein